MSADLLAAVDPVRLRRARGAKWASVEEDVLPAWVADMDFGVPPAVTAELHAAVQDMALGYPYHPDGDPVVAAFERRMHDRYQWAPRPGRARTFSDLIQVLQVVVEHATAPGDGVAVHVPTYPPFLASTTRSRRRLVPLPMVLAGGRWTFEAAGLADRLRSAGVRLLVLVNPHNPTGRAFDAAELRVLAEVATDLDLTVLSDEIHADLAYEGVRHVPFASLGDDVAARTVTATSATKAFNIAGVRCAVAHVGSDRLHEALDRAPLDYFGTPTDLGRAATVAAWERSDDWHRDLMGVLSANRATVADWAGSAGVRHVPPEATYLAWLDFAGTPLGRSDPAGAVHRHGRVLLSDGPPFAQHTPVDAATFARLNFATSPELVQRALDGIDRAMAHARRAS